MATNRLRHFNGCSIEELEPSHLQPRDECPAIDGLSCCGLGTCGHMRPPSKGWVGREKHAKGPYRRPESLLNQGRVWFYAENTPDVDFADYSEMHAFQNSVFGIFVVSPELGSCCFYGF